MAKKQKKSEIILDLLDEIERLEGELAVARIEIARYKHVLEHLVTDALVLLDGGMEG